MKSSFWEVKCHFWAVFILERVILGLFFMGREVFFWEVKCHFWAVFILERVILGLFFMGREVFFLGS